MPAQAGLGLSSPAGASSNGPWRSTPSTIPTLSDIRHVVILMQENRSFDHYFGTLSGVRGFSDPDIVTTRSTAAPARSGTSSATGPASAWTPTGTRAFPPATEVPDDKGDCTNDIRTRGDRSTRAGTAGRWTPSSRPTWRPTASTTSRHHGLLQAAELAFYYALADAFTICDAYHCSVLGPTDPNRVMALSGTIDPAGDRRRSRPRDADRGRPAAVRDVRLDHHARAAARCGRDLEGLQRPHRPRLFNPLPYFKAYNEPTTTRGPSCIAGASRRTTRPTSRPTSPPGRCPQVSWIHGPVAQCEHPATAPQWGENLVQNVLDTLTSNPEVWAHTLFILNYDENGGFFDHVPPPVPPAGTPGNT